MVFSLKDILLNIILEDVLPVVWLEWNVEIMGYLVLRRDILYWFSMILLWKFLLSLLKLIEIEILLDWSRLLHIKALGRVL